MNHQILRRIRKSKGGFTLIELLVVVLIIGILAAIAVPQYFKVVEKGKASEALATLDSLRSAQERYLAATGAYCIGSATFCAGIAGWDLTIPTMRYFTLGTPGDATAGGVPGWSVAVARIAPGAQVYGVYTVNYTATGGSPTITCTNSECQADLMPQ